MDKSENEYLIVKNFELINCEEYKGEIINYYPNNIYGLFGAVDNFRYATEKDYIAYDRLSELATLFKDGLIDAEQELFKSFNAKDGMGISCAIRCGLQVAIITGRCSPIIRRRARELGIVEVCENVKEKRSALAELLQKYNLSLNETAYVGDDLNDLPVLTQVGLACAPANAVEEEKQVCHFVAEKKGGCGAVRQITEFILNARGDWDKIVNSYLQEGQGDAQ